MPIRLIVIRRDARVHRLQSFRRSLDARDPCSSRRGSDTGDGRHSLQCRGELISPANVDLRFVWGIFGVRLDIIAYDRVSSYAIVAVNDS